MTEERFPTSLYCGQCAEWVALFSGPHSVMAQVEGKDMGICNNTGSDHNQHVIGCTHPACSEFVERWDLLKEELEVEAHG